MIEDDTNRLARRTFRSGASYELVPFERLSDDEQMVLAELQADPDFYGVLRPRPQSGRTLKGVDKDTALLWLTLQTPGPLPRFAWGDDAGAAVRGITQLVLDGVLELEDGGEFVSGPRAADRLCGPARAVPAGRLARLSRAALTYAESLRIDDGDVLCARIYNYGRQPVSPSWARRLADRAAVLAFVGAGPDGPLRRELDADWQMADVREPSGWIAWGHRRMNEIATSGATFKLYVSPDVEQMPESFAAVLAVLRQRGGHFKIGSDAAGLLRPDKMVLYFASQESLLRTATDLAQRLEGTHAHGVPFSAEIAGDGLLSWGMDPPAQGRVLTWHDQESWRLWVARRLALAMVSAQAAESASTSPAAFALERMRNEGVDVDGWTPSASLWQAA